ncbi:uncharacterized protein LOC100275325 [Zea mays]|uniref:Uncharacterized protein n=1 Tax=Zea mays TaxID=4577 RepID=B6SRC2_MAIZE|nr:uncharacterized protein LOC100275325 [Zea mays]ACG27405.1 hypothetical protein [Zea mays]ONM13185.1 hypothetical protein ZEAMMB73_Zm00001d002133 [Zea mays]
MASFTAQLRDKFLGVIDHITGWASGVAKDTPPEESTKLQSRTVQQPVEVRSRGDEEPIVQKGDEAGAN